MAPSPKRKSDEMAEPTTPEASSTPAPKKMRITQNQKQALIDNLQLEIAERARQLRAQYALQRADLKSRIERRINRIPVSMRTMTMAELFARHHEAEPAPPVKSVVVAKAQSTIPPVSRPTRKPKSPIVIAADPVIDESNMKEEESKSTQTAALPKTKNARHPGSRTGKTGGVLSPRSHNSRTLPRSPIKAAPSAVDQNSGQTDCRPVSPTKPIHFTRPHSPLKPSSPLKSAAIATTSAITSSMHNILATAKSTATRSKSSRSQTQPSQRTVSQASTHSTASNTTTTSTGTVVKGATTAATRSVRGRTATVAKKSAKGVSATVAAPAEPSVKVTTKSKTATVRRGAAAAASTVKKAVTSTAATTASAEPATGRRILRKRN